MSIQKWLPDDQQLLKLGLKLCSLTNELYRLYLLWNPQINSVEFEFKFFFKFRSVEVLQVEDADIEASNITLIPKDSTP